MEAITQVTECCICTESYVDPRMLPCIHTFCLKCLEETATKNGLKPGDTMPCPLCRNDCTIPREGIGGLQKNFFMTQFVEVTKTLFPLKTSATLCEICKEENSNGANEIPLATAYCNQCQKNICSQCCRDHKKFKDLKEHQLVPFGSQVKDDVTIKPTEKEKVCLDMSRKFHTGSDTWYQMVSGDLGRLDDFLKEAAERTKRIDEEMEILRKTVESTEKEIFARVNELKKLADRCESSLLEELASVKQKKSKAIEIAKEEIEMQRMIMESLKMCYNGLKDKGSPESIRKAFEEVHSRTDEMLNVHRKQNHQGVHSVQISFEATKLEDVVKTENIIGRLKVVDTSADEETKTKELKSVEIRLLKKLELLQSGVSGMTKHRNNIYVLCCGLIRVFDDRSPFGLLKEIEVKQIKMPSDIGSCDKSTCLYISDVNDRCIWKVATEDNRVTKWLDNVSDPFTLSVTEEGRVVILTNVEPSSQLELYEGKDAKLVRRIDLPSSVEDPLHAVQTPSGHFVVGHAVKENRQQVVKENRRWAISKLTGDGQIIGQFNPGNQSPLGFPCHLSLDSENNRLFVADFSNHKVILLDCDSLTFGKNLLTKENEIVWPRRLCSSGRNQLILRHSGEVINVYQLE